MGRNVSLNHVRFVVSDDPEQVIGTVLNMVAANLDGCGSFATMQT